LDAIQEGGPVGDVPASMLQALQALGEAQQGTTYMACSDSGRRTRAVTHDPPPTVPHTTIQAALYCNLKHPVS